MAKRFAPEPIRPTLWFLVTQPSFVIVPVGFCLTSYTNCATALTAANECICWPQRILERFIIAPQRTANA
jgi:hypothetical protein